MAKILLIEDDPLVVRMYQKVMSFEGFSIESAANGREGLKKAKEYKPDLIFLDIMMPKMNGIEVLEHLKADPELKHIPVIILTNLSGTHDAENALSKGAVFYMVKSEYKPKDVAAKAKEYLLKYGQVAQATPGQVPATASPQPSVSQMPAPVMPQTTTPAQTSTTSTQAKTPSAKIPAPTAAIQTQPTPTKKGL